MRTTVNVDVCYTWVTSRTHNEATATHIAVQLQAGGRKATIKTVTDTDGIVRFDIMICVPTREFLEKYKHVANYRHYVQEYENALNRLDNPIPEVMHPDAEFWAEYPPSIL